ncbi:MAG: hypothetical protein KC518_12845 [Candidatus Cloacimonetes bacterium]|nr:hypothetical protein [Candidatus Cloacimonadota bacterium]MCA9786187.1 hypothetical protein [Candidatus Cloacimonadota bacterium]
MARFVPLCASAILLAGLAGAAQSAGFMDGVTLRFNTGLNHLSGFDGMNSYIKSLNTYYGPNGFFPFDVAAGGSFGNGVGNDPFGGWRPQFVMDDFRNDTTFGFTLEKVVRQTEYTKLHAGLEYFSGNADTGNNFDFEVQGNISGSIVASERIELSGFMGTLRYSLRDLAMPLSGYVGVGLGMASLNSHGYEGFFQNNLATGNFIEFHRIKADHDGTTFSGRLFVGLERSMGPMSLMADFGYNLMNFKELDGKTTLSMAQLNPTGANYETLREVAIIGAPSDVRYDLLPLIRMVGNSTRISPLMFENSLDFADYADLWENQPIAPPKAIEYDFSGGFFKLGVGYNF